MWAAGGAAGPLVQPEQAGAEGTNHVSAMEALKTSPTDH